MTTVFNIRPTLDGPSLYALNQNLPIQPAGLNYYSFHNNTFAPLSPYSGGERWSSLHNSGGNLPYLDGHAEYKKGAPGANRITAADFGLLTHYGVNGTWDDNDTETYRAAF